jgi:hypothetical protein
MWLVKKVGSKGGLLCRTEESLALAKQHYEDLGEEYTVEETWTVELGDPMEQ